MTVDRMPRIKGIMTDNILEIDKLGQAFSYLMEQHIDIARREQELQKALGDKEALLKLQVQAATMEYVYGIFKFCYHQAKESQAGNE